MTEGELSRRERERQTHRREILAAAERVFARDGYAGATVERIAQEAEFAVGTLYNFFESKEKLLEEVIADLANEVFELLEVRVFREPDPMKALDALIELRLRAPQEHRDFARVFFEAGPSAALDPGSALPRACEELYQRYFRAVTAMLGRGIAAGVFRDEDPLCLALCLEGAFRAIGVYWIEHDPAEPLAARVASVKRVLVPLVCKPSGHGEEVRR